MLNGKKPVTVPPKKSHGNLNITALLPEAAILAMKLAGKDALQNSL